MYRDSATVLDILVAARRVVEFVGSLDKEQFLSDLKTQAAATHQVLIMGEATKRLSAEYRQEHAEVPWSEMARTRDKLIHHYEEVDVDQLCL